MFRVERADSEAATEAGNMANLILLLEDNPRMAQMFATWGRMSDDKRQAYRETAKAFLDQL
ncbi:hypothetical protein HY29_13115 [Hyphomonas beringensis]|uniref:Uncharacterized protein n=1 Tax=Hyphomonas beringensis TaxID=1280946 RepID=A0A062UFG6_9PROT|nr:hypothetical protein HY29_13115 [Hyphomonas beringensis]